MTEFVVNGEAVTVDAAPDTSLLFVLRDHLGLTGTKFGCGATMCGACTVHVDGVPTFACVTPVEMAEGAEVTTIEGLGAALGDGETHKLQRAWVAEQVPQCGYCQSGQIMRAAALLEENPNPTREEIVDTMSANLCRCGTYPRIVRAIERAAKEV